MPLPCRYEAIHHDGDGPGPWCVVSTDPADLWQELAGRTRPTALDGDQADHALLLAALTSGSHPADRIPPPGSAKTRHTAK